MAVIRKSITLTAQQDAFVKSLIEQGLYTNDMPATTKYKRGEF